jgi:hypothetical protein
LKPHQCAAIEAVEDSSFRYGTATHSANAKLLGLADGSERAVQRNMAEFGVGTYLAQQKKFISDSFIEKHKIWGLNVVIGRKKILSITALQMNAISLVVFNVKLEFIIDVAIKHEMLP